MHQSPRFYFKVVVVRLLIVLLVGLSGVTLAIAEPQPSAPQTSQAPYVAQYEGRITVRADRTATDIFTQRLRIQKRSAIQTVSQQQLSFIEEIGRAHV